MRLDYIVSLLSSDSFRHHLGAFGRYSWSQKEQGLDEIYV